MQHTGHHDPAHGHRATSVSDLRHPMHGSYQGHVVPGVMFLCLSSYWIVSIVDIALRAPGSDTGQRSRTGSKAGGRLRHAYVNLHNTAFMRDCNPATGRGCIFTSRAWYPWPTVPCVALEPIAKLLFPLLGVLVELYIGWGAWRPMYETDGHFSEFHANNWQHALMYTAFAVSGAVDLLGCVSPLPHGTEQGFLALAFGTEALLMGLHSKPNALDQLVHTLLTGLMLASAGLTVAEIAAPRSVLLALARACVVMAQGTWFWNVGAIMFTDTMAWDMEDMASTMFVPIVFCLQLLAIALGALTLYLGMRCLYSRLGLLGEAASCCGCTSLDTSAADDAAVDTELGGSTAAGAVAAAAADTLELCGLRWGNDQVSARERCGAPGAKAGMSA